MTRVKAHFRKTKKGRIKIKAHDRSIKRKRRFKVREGETPVESAKNIFQEKLDAVSINPSMAGKVESALSGPLKNKTGGAIRLRRKKKVRDFLPGGLADGIPDSAFNKVQLRKGIKVELEHTKNKELAKEIAKDHLTEHPDYYKALRKMEDRLEKRRMRDPEIFDTVGERDETDFDFVLSELKSKKDFIQTFDKPKYANNERVQRELKKNKKFVEEWEGE